MSCGSMARRRARTRREYRYEPPADDFLVGYVEEHTLNRWGAVVAPREPLERAVCGPSAWFSAGGARVVC